MIKEGIKDFFKNLRRLFKYKQKDRRYSTKTILVAGGYGYGNVGDEAQCDATLSLLKERYKDYQIINLTPDINYSKAQHPNFTHNFASRNLLFNQNRTFNYFFYDNSKLAQTLFLLKAILVLLNAYLVRADLPTVLINARSAKFLYELKEASLFYFCGGGYLTGSTLSRLWDGAVISKLCSIFKTPIVLSGQTIGVWGNKFNESVAKWGFRNVKAITTRDEEFSINDLKRIGLDKKIKDIFPTHDDALFCSKSEIKQVEDDNYITINFHYWGMDEKQKLETIEKIHSIVEFVLNNTDSNLVFIPMHHTDKLSFDDYIKKYPSNRFTCFNYDYDFRKVRRVIADSKVCLTMKHHPIIFAVGETTPCISLAFSKYYVHKNLGALAQYGIEKYSINLEDERYFNQFEELFNDILNNYGKIQGIIEEHKGILKERKEKFLKIVDEVLN